MRCVAESDRPILPKRAIVVLETNGAGHVLNPGEEGYEEALASTRSGMMDKGIQDVISADLLTLTDPIDMTKLPTAR